MDFALESTARTTPSTQSFHILPVSLRGVAVDQFAQRGIGLDHAGIDAQMAALEQAVFEQAAQHQLQRRLVGLGAEPPADHAQTRTIRGGFLQPVAEAQRERVGSAAGDSALPRKVFEEADHEHLEIGGRADARATAARGIGEGGQADIADAGGESDGF